MPKKNPATAEWLSRCVDVTVSVTDGKSENDRQEGYTLFVTIPPYADLERKSADLNAISNKVVKEMLGEKRNASVKVGAKYLPTNQYSFYGKGSFDKLEDFVLSKFDAMSPILGVTADKWKKNLETFRPSRTTNPNPGTAMARFSPEELAKLCEFPNIKLAIQETQADPYSLKLSSVLKENRAAVVAQFGEELGRKLDETESDISSYKNNIRQKMEIWLTRAFLPLSAPYMAPLFKNNTGEPVSFDSPDEYYSRLCDKAFSEDFSKMPMMTLASTGVINCKVFPVSPWRLHVQTPRVQTNGKSVVVKFNWMQSHMHWQLTNTILDMLKSKYPETSVTDSRKRNTGGTNKYPDPFGLETMYTLTATIPMQDEKTADSLERGLQPVLDKLYVDDGLAVSEPLQRTVDNLRKSADLITKQLDKNHEAAEEQRRTMKVENRIVPFAAKSAIFIQVKDAEIPKALLEACNEAIKDHPDWKINSINESKGAMYQSIFLNSSHTSEGAGLAERFALANEVADKFEQKTGERSFNVESPDGGFTIEVSKRHINAQDKTDDSEGIYVKFPNAVAEGGKLYEKSIEDESFADSLDPVSKGFYNFGEEFGKSSARKSMLKLFTPASSPLESYTRTWMYKLKKEDDVAAKEASIKQLIEERKAELFPSDAVVSIDWMPDRAARKLAEVNQEIKLFASNWESNLFNHEAEKNQETVDGPER